MHKKFKLKNKLKSQSGFSLVETLVALVVMSILMVGFMQMMGNQAKQTKGLEETLARLDLEKTLQTYLADGSICGATLAGATPKTFNVANLATTSFSVSSLPAGAQAGAPSLIAVNQKASSLSNSLMVAGITYKNIQNTGVADKYNMDLEVSFIGGIRPLRPLLFKMILNTTNDTTTGIKRVTGCNSSSMNANICASLGGTYDPATGNCSGVGGNITAAECAALNGIYNWANHTCTDQGVQEYTGATCPVGKTAISWYWTPKSCAGNPGCTVGGWVGVGGPPTCVYVVNSLGEGSSAPGVCALDLVFGGLHIYNQQTPTKVLCL